LSDDSPSIEMTKDEMDTFLSQPILARLATIRDDRPHVTPIWFVWDGESIWMETVPDYLKVKNLRQNPNCAVTVDTTDGGIRIKGVIMEGEAELIDEPEDLVMDIVRRIYVNYMGEESLVATTPKKMYDGPHILIKLTPKKVITWNWTQKGIAPLL
jgi:PPOX class probable F420-dependent enzyme